MATSALSEASTPAPTAEAGSDQPHVVIVGAGFGGLAAAKRLGGKPVRVTVIDRRNHHLFQPLLYQVAIAGLSPSDIAWPLRALVRKYPNVDVLLDEVTDIAPEQKLVRTRHKELRYDRLILATGAENSYFGHDRWRQSAAGLKSLADATEIRRRILGAFERAEVAADEAERRRLLTFVLIGGGPTGVEMAGALSHLARHMLVRDFRHVDTSAASIILLEAADQLLPGFPKDLAGFARRVLAAGGVDVRIGCPVEEIDEEGVVAGGERIAAATVVWSAGVRATPVAQWLKADANPKGQVKVNPDLTVPGLPEVFLIGDAALALGRDGKPLPGLAAVAKQQGEYAAEHILRPLRGRQPPGPFRYRDWGTLATMSRSSAVADFGWVRLRGRLAWVVWGLVHIYYLIGFRNRLRVLLNWLWQYATYAPSERIIIDRR